MAQTHGRWRLVISKRRSSDVGSTLSLAILADAIRRETDGRISKPIALMSSAASQVQTSTRTFNAHDMPPDEPAQSNLSRLYRSAQSNPSRQQHMGRVPTVSCRTRQYCGTTATTALPHHSTAAPLHHRTARRHRLTATPSHRRKTAALLLRHCILSIADPHLQRLQDLPVRQTQPALSCLRRVVRD